jgi:acyl-coenzyme A synthetase/AMP-(fatty) acid ligase
MIQKIIKKYRGISIIDSNSTYSFSDLDNQIDKYAVSLKHEIIENENILICSDYNFFSISLLIYLSSLKVNIIPVVKTTKKEIDTKILESRPSKVIYLNSKGEISVYRPKVVKENTKIIVPKNSTGLILFSSGTTGKPKVMVQNLTKLISSINVPKKQKSLVFLIFLMFDHIGGINTLLRCLISGSPIVVPTDRKPSTIIKLIEKYKINVLPTSPTFLNLLLLDDEFNNESFKSLKLITYGTERMPEILLKKIHKIFPRIKLMQTFGTSETGIIKTQSKSSNSLLFKIVDDDNNYKVIDGELYLKSKNSVDGYENQESDNFLENGWYKTGDLVEEFDNGYIKIIGRKNNIINVGGLKVFPSEVENIINEIDGIIDSTVYGEANNITGNIVCARINTHLEHTTTLKNKIKKYCKMHLDKYKIPVRIKFSKLEINSRGKKSQ